MGVGEVSDWQGWGSVASGAQARGTLWGGFSLALLLPFLCASATR